MTRLMIRLHFVAAIALLSLVPSARSAPSVSAQLASQLRGGTITSNNGQTQFTADTSRPFSLAIEVMRVQYGAVICYEDPLYSDPDDVAPTMQKGVRTTRIPAGGKLSLTYSDNDVATVLKQLAKVRLTPDRGAHFNVSQVGSVFMFIPLDSRDSNGNRGASQSPLDALITMAAASRPASETLGTILNLAAEASNHHIVYMTPPGPDHPGDPTYEIGAQNETARSVLLRALSLMEPNKGSMAWDLFFDPDSGQYYMNFIPVMKNKSSAATPGSTGSRVAPAMSNAADSGVTSH